MLRTPTPLIGTLGVMKMDLGYFPNFGWSDSLVLGGDRSEIVELRLIILGFLESNDAILPIHSLPFVSAHAGAKLYFVRTTETETDGFNWICPDINAKDVNGMLWALVMAEGPGHQYFDLLPKGFDLVVSFAEYGRHLWQDSVEPRLPARL